MIVCNVTIPGKPVPWARAVDNASGVGRHTPPAQRAFKRTVQQYLTFGVSPRIRLQPKGVALNLACRVFLPFDPKLSPADVDAMQRRPGGCYATDRPDLDNWLKLPMDAANGIVWQDDCQVVSFDGSGKFYSLSPRLEFVVVRLGE